VAKSARTSSRLASTASARWPRTLKATCSACTRWF